MKLTGLSLSSVLQRHLPPGQAQNGCLNPSETSSSSTLSKGRRPTPDCVLDNHQRRTDLTRWPLSALRARIANLGRVSPSVHFEFEICDRDGRAALTRTIVIAIFASPCALVIGQIAFAKIQTSRTRPIFGLYRVTLWLANLIAAFSNLGTRRSLR